MEITEALIRKFFDDTCTPEEADMVSRYFEENPAELKRYLGADWKEAGREGRGKGITRRMIIGWAAAAVIILIAGSGLLYLRQNKEVVSTVRKIDTTAVGATAWKWQVRVNRSLDRQKVLLPDGSVVALYGQAKIIYRDPFAADKREITLEGQASFNVARDVAKPFTVKAGSTTTTVLGTCFNVQENEQGVTVRLYRGKVSVRAVVKEFVLSPGQQVKVEKGKDTGEVSLFKRETAEVSAKDNSVVGDNKEVLVFDNTPLPEVLKKLVLHYRVQIQYDANVLNNMYFTGSVLKSDSLSIILRGIANTNDLTIARNENGFVVSGLP